MPMEKGNEIGRQGTDGCATRNFVLTFGLIWLNFAYETKIMDHGHDPVMAGSSGHDWIHR